MKEIDMFRNKMSRNQFYKDVVYPATRTPDQLTSIEKEGIVVDLGMVKKWMIHFEKNKNLRHSRDGLTCFVRGVFPFHTFTKYVANNPKTPTKNNKPNHYGICLTNMDGNSVKTHRKLWRGNHTTYFIQHILEVLSDPKRRKNFWKEVDIVPKTPKDSKYIFVQHGESEVWEGKVAEELASIKNLPIPHAKPPIVSPPTLNISQEQKGNPRQEFERKFFKIMKEFQENSGMVINSIIYDNKEPSKTCGADMAFTSEDWAKKA